MNPNQVEELLKKTGELRKMEQEAAGRAGNRIITQMINILAHIVRRLPLADQLPDHPLLIMGLWAVIFVILLWKFLLLTITLRLAGNLNFGKIILALFLLILITAAYWSLTFNLGWMKVPFI